MEKIEQDRHVSSHDKELNIDHKTVLNHLEKSRLKKELDVWVPHDLTEKFNGSNFYLRVIAKTTKSNHF